MKFVKKTTYELPALTIKPIMFENFLRTAALLLILALSSCGGGNQEPAEADKSSDPPSQDKRETVPQTPLYASGYSDEPIRVQMAPDLFERHSPSPKFLFVRYNVAGQTQFVPGNCQLEIDGKKKTPHAIGFGRPNGEYLSVESFVGENVEIVPAAADQLFHDGEHVQKVELKNLMVFLVYDVEQASNLKLHAGDQVSPLYPDFQKLAADLTGTGGLLTAKGGLNLNTPNAASEDYEAKLLGTTRTRVELDTQTLDVVIVELALSAEKATEIEIKKSELQFGGAGQGRVYFHFPEGTAELTAGSERVEGEMYEGRELIGLESGSFRVSLTPNSPVNMMMILRDPKVPGDLDLKLSASKSMTIPEPVNPLGKFPPPVEKLPGMVAWAPMIGPPLDANYLDGTTTIAADSKQIASATAAKPGDGLRYLQVTFRVEREGEFVPIDYRLVDRESNTIYRPLAVAFGGSSTFVKGLDYEKIPLKFGDSDSPQHAGGRVSAWTIGKREVKLIYEVAPSDAFIFLHGGTQFVIEL